jgi:hypothetical protein
MRLNKLLPLLAFLALLSISASAADYVAPLAFSSGNLSSSITTTNTFQTIQIVSKSRNGCAVQNQSTNNSSDTMWVYFDPTNSSNCSAATKARSFTLTPGQSINCNVGTIIVSDEVCITGTGGDTFTANFQ